MKIYDEKQFIGLNNLDKAFKMNRRVTILAIIIIPVIVIAFLITSYKNDLSAKNSVYLLTENGVSILKRTSVQENREVEGTMHISLFYERFLDLDPDQEAINKKLESCYYLGGDVIKDLVDYYKESGFYDKLIGENIIMRHELNYEDVHIDMTTYPYQVTAIGKQILSRQSNRVEKSFNIKCVLYNLKERTTMNPHAFRIERLMITDNKSIKE